MGAHNLPRLLILSHSFILIAMLPTLHAPGLRQHHGPSTLALLFILTVAVASATPDPNYLGIARAQADALLEFGLDRHGVEHSSLWASVIDVENRLVPADGVPPTPGVRQYDQAVGGTNLLHETATLKLMDALSSVTGDPQYRQAANSYIVDYFRLAQSEANGLLGWGEHLYYNFFADEVTAGPLDPAPRREYYYREMPHELLEKTPPWSRLALVDMAATQRAIAGLIYHFQGPDPQTYSFNRHAFYHRAEHQSQIMPWIKHTALYSYSWMERRFKIRRLGLPHWRFLLQSAGSAHWAPLWHPLSSRRRTRQSRQPEQRRLLCLLALPSV